MDDSTKPIEALFEKAIDYSKTTYELVKLKSLEISSDVVSSLVPHSIVFVLFASFMLFVNFGLAYWIGAILGNTYYGFFIVAAFYILTGLILHIFFHKRIKNKVWNYIIKQVLK